MSDTEARCPQLELECSSNLMCSDLQNTAKTNSCSPTSDRPEEDEGDALLSTRPAQKIKKIDPTSFPSPLNPVNELGVLVIASIRAADVATGLRRIPAGFYTAVRHSGYEWRTANKPVLLNNDAVEWSGPIPIPSDRFTTVCFGIFAAFEFQPMLGSGELLRELVINAEELWNRGANELSFSFSDDGKVTSPCSSLSVTLREWKYTSSKSLEEKILEPHRSTTEPLDQLEEATNHAHSAFLRYRRHGETQELGRSIDLFELALDICPLDHPSRAVSQTNLAMAKFFRYLDNDNDYSLDIPVILYRDALAVRPVGHPDRPATLIQLATVLLSRFDERRQEVDAARAEVFLREAISLTPAERHENKAAAFLLQMHIGGTEGYDQKIDQTSAGQISTSAAVNENPWAFSEMLLRRFEQFGDLADLQSAISILETIVASTLVLDDQCFGGLARLGGAFLHRFFCLGELNDLEQAIARSTEAVERTPPGHPNKSDCINNLATALRTRFERLGELHDLERAISKLREAVASTADGRPDKFRILNGLANCLLTRFKRLGHLDDLEDAISRFMEVVELTPDEHPDKPGRLNNLANSILARFWRLGELGDLDNATSKHKNAVAITRNGSPDKPSYLGNYGSSLLARFQRLGEMSNLEDAILILREAVELTSVGHPDEPDYLGRLACAFETRFKSCSNPVDLERAISGYRKAVELTPDGHNAQPGRMTNLGDALSIRFQLLGHFSDLEEAISKHKEAINLLPEHHPAMPDCLNNLACSLSARFQQLEKLDDLEDAISACRKAVELVPDNHLRKPTLLRNLGDALLIRFERLGKQSDLEEVISRLRVSDRLTPDGHVNKPACLGSLGTSFLTRFERLGELDDCEEAISRLRKADKATVDGHVDKPGHINNLGNAFYARFNRLGELSDLEEAISSYNRAVDLIPDGHVNKPTHLINLGNSLLSRFERLGKLEDLEEGILRFRKGVELSSNDDAGDLKPQVTYLNDLGNALRTRFEQLGELSDIEEAISMLRKVTEATPNAHAEKPVYLNNLGSAFVARFERLREPRDIEEALSRIREAVELTPDDHPNKPTRLNNLGSCLDARFEQLGQLSDLEEAISLLKKTAVLGPDDHPDKPACLTNLGISLKRRFTRLGQLSDLEDAVSSHRKSVELTPDNHPEKPSRLSNLANSLGARFEHHGNQVDLDERISKIKGAVDLTPQGHSDKPAYLNNLALAFKARFDQLGDSSDLEQAILQFSRAASSSTGPTLVRFHASQGWISCAQSCGHSSLLRAYSAAIGLLPQLAWIGLSLTHRYNQLVQGANVVREAAAAALDAGQPTTAVEWLEQGRSIVWGELFQLRSSYEELASVHPDYANQLRKLSIMLEQASSTRDKLMSLLVERSRRVERPLEMSLEQEAEKQRMLAIERDRLLQAIRGLPGFERFLLHKEFSSLRASAHSGPVVILNAAEKRCDALVVLADKEDITHVPLANFTRARSGALQNALGTLLGDARGMESGDREGQRATPQQVRWESLLSVLWKGVVKPVLDALAISASGELSRIFWCPTGHFTFLPIHAAGLYESQFSEPGHKISDFVISSYVPSLSILFPMDATHVGGVRLLAVHQPHSDGQSRLPGVHLELEHIRSAIRNSDSQHTLLESSTGTVEEVLELMQDANWVHFACHGIQDPENATESGLCLADRRRLKVSDMLSLSRPRGTGGLAFLSACQTARGEVNLSDEAIHIAAGMLFAGYGSVIGTLWSIGDGVAPRVAQDVYGQLFRKERVADCRDAARALHDAVERLRQSNASFVEWLPFIHVGL